MVGIGEILWDMLPAGKQLGGAPANFAYHAGALEAKETVVSRVGEDALGHEILQRLNSIGLDSRYVATDTAHPTGTVDVSLDPQGVPTYVIHREVRGIICRPPPNWLNLQNGPMRSASARWGSARRNRAKQSRNFSGRRAPPASASSTSTCGSRTTPAG